MAFENQFQADRNLGFVAKPQQQRQQQQLAQQQQTVLVESDSETGQGSQAEVKVQVEEVKAQVPPASRKRPSIGRILNDDEW